MNVFTISIPSSSSPRTLTYTVKIKGYNNLWTTVFNGKVYVSPNQSSVKIDLEDILHNHKFDGTDYFAPALNSSGDNYVMCTTANTIYNYWYNLVRVEFPTLNNTPYAEKYVKFFNYNMFTSHSADVQNGLVALNMDYQPVAHIPANAPEGFAYRQLVWKGSFMRGIDNTYTAMQRSNLGVIQYSGGTKKYSLNNKVIALIDQCARPYYLCWITNTGGMQVQPFLKGSEASVKYTNNTRVDMTNFEWGFNKTTRGNWTLKSENLSDKDYKAFGEMFNSPYLVLLDMENSKLHFVNVTDTTYKEKKNAPGSKKIYFEVKVESSEVKVI